MQITVEETDSGACAVSFDGNGGIKKSMALLVYGVTAVLERNLQPDRTEDGITEFCDLLQRLHKADKQLFEVRLK